jgi:aspartate aminotransferase
MLSIEAQKEIRNLFGYVLTNGLMTGARIAAAVLSDAVLVEEWKRDLAVMSGRLKTMRQALYDELLRLKTPGTWNHIISQIGMFCYTGLTREQVKMLIEEYHIYLMDSGRISIAGCMSLSSYPHFNHTNSFLLHLWRSSSLLVF